MPEGRLRFEPGTLWPTILRRTERALRCDALHPIGTEERYVKEGGVRLVVRMVPSLARKDEERARKAASASGSGEAPDPFLSYDPALFVEDVSDTHVCLLNRFPVIEHHILIVTREFEDQETLLTLPDFEALWACMAEFEGLGFYNGGAAAGASQPHKHLQMVPLPLAGEGPAIPIEPLLAGVRAKHTARWIPGLPSRHAFAWLDPALAGHPQAALARYRAMLDAVGVRAVPMGGEARQSAPYNLLVTREWMLLVPRSKEFFGPVSVNALGFAGALFVRDEEEMRIVEAHGPMTVLREVGLPDLP